MTLDEIKKAVNHGKTVCWANEGYEVIQDDHGRYLIHCKINDHFCGLTHRDGKTMNGTEHQFFVKGQGINNKFNTKGLRVGEAVYIEPTNAVGRVIDGGPAEEWGSQCRTDADGVQLFRDLSRLTHWDFKIHGPKVASSFNEEVKYYNPNNIRKVSPGYIGGRNIAEKATDGEVVMLAELNDHLARLYNRGESAELYETFAENIKSNIRNR